MHVPAPEAAEVSGAHRLFANWNAGVCALLFLLKQWHTAALLLTLLHICCDLTKREMQSKRLQHTLQDWWALRTMVSMHLSLSRAGRS